LDLAGNKELQPGTYTYPFVTILREDLPASYQDAKDQGPEVNLTNGYVLLHPLSAKLNSCLVLISLIKPPLNILSLLNVILPKLIIPPIKFQQLKLSMLSKLSQLICYLNKLPLER
jgi:hypothetical protein